MLGPERVWAASPRSWESPWVKRGSGPPPARGPTARTDQTTVRAVLGRRAPRVVSKSPATLPCPPPKSTFWVSGPMFLSHPRAQRLGLSSASSESSVHPHSQPRGSSPLLSPTRPHVTSPSLGIPEHLDKADTLPVPGLWTVPSTPPRQERVTATRGQSLVPRGLAPS